MTDQKESTSEIARIRELIQKEYDAGQLALHGPTLGTAQHRFMTARMENIAGYLGQLRATYGDAVADQTMMDEGSEETFETNTAGHQTANEHHDKGDC
jgi:hypothetical protein